MKYIAIALGLCLSIPAFANPHSNPHCEQIQDKANRTWQQHLSRSPNIQKHCQRAKYNCQNLREEIHPQAAAYMELYTACYLGTDVTQSMIDALPALTPSTGYICCFGNKAPEFSFSWESWPAQ